MDHAGNMTITELINRLENIQRDIVRTEHRMNEVIHRVSSEYRHSARNLIHYLCLRTYDLRPIQEALSSLSLSSIGHSEGYTLHNINQILHWLHILQATKTNDPIPDLYNGPINYKQHHDLLRINTSRLLGPQKHAGHSRIMVTLPAEAASNYSLVLNLMQAGMDIARINTSHDDATVWEKMIKNIQQAKVETQSNCRVYMDIAGPKLRTGPIPEVPGAKKRKKSKRHKNHYILVRRGDTLILSRNQITAKLPKFNESGKLLKPGMLSTSLPEIFDSVKQGENIWFDDGKIGATIMKKDEDFLELQITHAKENGTKLRPEKGINLPETDLALSPLTDYDRQTLPFICQHADMLGFSFVRKPDDVAFLQNKLNSLDRPDIGIILKIETQEAFQHFPALLMQAMQSENVGVMIARGDLAVEIGWTRIAEVQEQIMWMCEAAHIPDIWATQVLENLAKTGTATRAEITDVSTAVRAECVMLNKGPYIVDAVNTVTNIDHRMSAHMEKKMMSLRPLKVAQFYFDRDGVPV